MADCAPTVAVAEQPVGDVDSATCQGKPSSASRPLLFRTHDGKMLVLSSSTSSACKDSEQTDTSSASSKGHHQHQALASMAPNSSTSTVFSKNDSSLPSGKSTASKAAVSFSHALHGLQPAALPCSNGSTSIDGCPSLDPAADGAAEAEGAESSLPKIRFSFPSMGGRLLPKASSAAVNSSQQQQPSSQLPQIGASFSATNPRFVIVKSAAALGTTSSAAAISNATSSRPILLSSAASSSSSHAANHHDQQRILLRGVDSKSSFISSAGLKRKLDEHPTRTIAVTKGAPSVYLMPSSAAISSHNHNLSATLTTNKSQQNGKLLYISSTDAIVALKENTMKKRQLMNNRRPCNCTKSQCLKLYCDCFANGEFCSNCHCTNCLNNLANEVDRSKAIKSCLERNPMAFQPKIGKGKADTDRLHNKGCNCKKSSCLKNYCECYEARVSCTVRCKCFGCRNTEADRSSRNRGSLTSLAGSAASAGGPLYAYGNLTGDYPPLSPSSSTEDLNDRMEPKRLPKKFINDEIIEAITRVMVATAEDLSNGGVDDDEQVQVEIIKVFGNCLKKLVDTVSI